MSLQIQRVHSSKNNEIKENYKPRTFKEIKDKKKIPKAHREKGHNFKTVSQFHNLGIHFQPNQQLSRSLE